MQAGSSVAVACTLVAAMQTKQGCQHSQQTAHSSLQQQSPLTCKAVNSSSHYYQQQWLLMRRHQHLVMPVRGH
jgi:hypothetical protein